MVKRGGRVHHGEELSNLQFLSLDEQRFQAEQRIMGQRDRHATARFLGMHIPVEIRTPEVPPRFASEERVEEYRLEQLAKLPYVLSYEEAKARLEKRQNALVLPLITPETEPRSYKRRVPSRATMNKHVGSKDDTGGG